MAQAKCADAVAESLSALAPPPCHPTRRPLDGGGATGHCPAMERLPDSAEAIRPGERPFSRPLPDPDDAGLVFIGRVLSPWKERRACPKNLREARERGEKAIVHVDAPFAEALVGLAPGTRVFLLTWLDRARRDLALQMPRHAEAPRGTFTLRSPVRPNPIGLHLVEILSIDAGRGRLEIDAVDVLDGTPLLDIKPYFPSVDAPPEG